MFQLLLLSLSFRLQEGLNNNGVLSYIKQNPSIMETAFVHTAAALDAGDLVDLYVVAEWSPEGSNKRRIEAEMYSYWLDYLLDKEGIYMECKIKLLRMFVM